MLVLLRRRVGYTVVGMPNVNDMLADLAASDGRVIYDEGEPPYPIAVIESAVDMGLVSHFMSGGMQSTDVTIKLTALGRQRVGLAPLLPWYKAAYDWVRRIYPLSTNRKCE